MWARVSVWPDVAPDPERWEVHSFCRHCCWRLHSLWGWTKRGKRKLYTWHLFSSFLLYMNESRTSATVSLWCLLKLVFKFWLKERTMAENLPKHPTILHIIWQVWTEQNNVRWCILLYRIYTENVTSQKNLIAYTLRTKRSHLLEH